MNSGMTHYVGDDCPGGHEDWTKWLTQEERSRAKIHRPQNRLYCLGCYDDWPCELVTLYRSLAASRALVEELNEAGVTDYNKINEGSHRVDCHMCTGIWTTGQPAKHSEGCPLVLTEADMLKRVKEK